MGPMDSAQFRTAESPASSPSRTPSDGPLNGFLSRLRNRSRTHGGEAGDMLSPPISTSGGALLEVPHGTEGSPGKKRKSKAGKLLRTISGSSRRHETWVRASPVPEGSNTTSESKREDSEGEPSGEARLSDDFALPLQDASQLLVIDMEAIRPPTSRETSSVEPFTARNRSAPSSPRDISASAVKFIRRSLNHQRESSDLSSPRVDTSRATGLREEESAIVDAVQHLSNGESVESLGRIDLAIRLYQGRCSHDDLPAIFFLACAHYHRARLGWSEAGYNSAEFHVRESLSLLDRLLLEEGSRLEVSKSSASKASKEWVPTLHNRSMITLDTVWLRRSQVEDLVSLCPPFLHS
jgi:hypothetical protein